MLSIFGINFLNCNFSLNSIYKLNICLANHGLKSIAQVSFDFKETKPQGSLTMVLFIS